MKIGDRVVVINGSSYLCGRAGNVVGVSTFGTGPALVGITLDGEDVPMAFTEWEIEVV